MAHLFRRPPQPATAVARRYQVPAAHYSLDVGLPTKIAQLATRCRNRPSSAAFVLAKPRLDPVCPRTANPR